MTIPKFETNDDSEMNAAEYLEALEFLCRMGMATDAERNTVALADASRR